MSPRARRILRRSSFLERAIRWEVSEITERNP